VYFEYTWDGQGGWDRIDDAPPFSWINTTHTFTVLFNNPKPGEYTMEMDNGTTGEKYYTFSDFTPNNGQAYGETHSAADQMAGGYNNKETFRNEHVWLPNQGWVPAALYAWKSSSWYGYDKPNATDENIWDGACAN
jgi:hypothetical protein